MTNKFSSENIKTNLLIAYEWSLPFLANNPIQKLDVMTNLKYSLIFKIVEQKCKYFFFYHSNNI